MTEEEGFSPSVLRTLAHSKLLNNDFLARIIEFNVHEDGAEIVYECCGIDLNAFISQDFYNLSWKQKKDLMFQLAWVSL